MRVIKVYLDIKFELWEILNMGDKNFKNQLTCFSKLNVNSLIA